MRAGSSRFRMPAHSGWALAICLSFAGLIVAGAFVAKDPAAMFRAMAAFGNGQRMGAGEGAGRAPAPLTGARDLGPNDPVVRFSDTRVGHVLYAGTNSDTCRRLYFNNSTGSYHETPEIFCGQVAEPPTAMDGRERLAAVRKSFQRE